MCRQRADVIDPGPSEFIRRSSTTVLHLYLCSCPLPGQFLSHSLALPPSASVPVCLLLSSSMHYSFIILLQLPYRPHFGEDKTCHLWVESEEMMGDFKEEEVEGRRVGVKNACCPPFFHISLSLFSLLPCSFFTLAHAVSLCNENLSLIEGAAASWPRAAGLDCDTGYVTVMLIEVADQ